MHKCLGPISVHASVANHNDGSLLFMYHEHRKPGWYDQTVKAGHCRSPAHLRRWMRMVTQEVHRRGITP